MLLNSEIFVMLKLPFTTTITTTATAATTTTFDFCFRGLVFCFYFMSLISAFLSPIQQRYSTDGTQPAKHRTKRDDQVCKK